MSDVKSRRAEYALLTRQAVLDSARDLFVAKGFADTSIDDIAQGSRVSKGAVYHHFADKQELFAELFRTSQTAVLVSVAKAASVPATPWERARLAVGAFLRAYVHDQTSKVLLRDSIPVLGQRRVRELDDETALPLVMALLDELDAAGELRPVSKPLTARIIFGTLCEAATLVAATAAPEEIATLGETVVVHMLQGLRLPSSS